MGRSPLGARVNRRGLARLNQLRKQPHGEPPFYKRGRRSSRLYSIRKTPSRILLTEKISTSRQRIQCKEGRFCPAHVALLLGEVISVGDFFVQLLSGLIASSIIELIKFLLAIPKGGALMFPDMANYLPA